MTSAKKTITTKAILLLSILLSACGDSGADHTKDTEKDPANPTLSAALAICEGVNVINVADHSINGLRVVDGDSVNITEADGTVHKIRLAGIDAPEKSQPYGLISKQTLTDCLADSIVSVHWQDKDRYGRLVGKVIADKVDCNLQQVANGSAWHYKVYQKEQSALDQALYSNAEVQARSTELGLWQAPYPIAPWDFRKKITSIEQLNYQFDNTLIATDGLQHCETDEADESDKTDVDTDIDTDTEKDKGNGKEDGNGLAVCASMIKKTCSKMSSCVEAEQQLLCGNTAIDGNKDGIPCNSLCK